MSRKDIINFTYESKWKKIFHLDIRYCTIYIMNCIIEIIHEKHFHTNKSKCSEKLKLCSVVMMHFRATRDGNWACKISCSWVTNTAKRKLQTSWRLAPSVCAISREFLIDVDPLDLSIVVVDKLSVDELFHRTPGLNGCQSINFPPLSKCGNDKIILKQFIK